MTDTVSINDLLGYVEEGAISVGKHFTNPEDDWVPILFLWMPVGLAMTPLVEDDQATRNAKITAAIALSGCSGAAFVSSAWAIKRPAKPGKKIRWQDGHERPSLAPDRVECVVIAAVTLDGWGSTVATIERHPDKPPTLAPWERSEAVDGGILAAMRAGFEAQS